MKAWVKRLAQLAMLLAGVGCLLSFAFTLMLWFDMGNGLFPMPVTRRILLLGLFLLALLHVVFDARINYGVARWQRWRVYRQSAPRALYFIHIGIVLYCACLVVLHEFGMFKHSGMADQIAPSLPLAMIVFSALFLMFYTAAKHPHYVLGRRCPNHHCLPRDAKYCPWCGPVLSQQWTDFWPKEDKN